MKSLVLFFSIFFISTAYAETSLNLNECYKAALKKSEILSEKTELINQAKEKIDQAKSGMLPTMNAYASILNQDSSNLNLPASNTSNQSIVKLTATQSVFRGNRDSALEDQARANVIVQTQFKEFSKNQLYVEVAQNFYGILSLEKDLQSIHLQINLYEKRILELKERLQIGRSRVNEVLTTQAALANLQATAKQLTGVVQNYRENFSYLTGLGPQSALLEEDKINYKELKLLPLENYLKNKEERPDIKALKFQKQASEEGVRIAQAGHWPTVDVGANYYFVRKGSGENINWDVLASVNFPLFDGNLVQSKVREANSVKYQAEIVHHRGLRQVETEIRNLYLSIVSEKLQLQTLDEVKQISEKNYRKVQEDYRLGLVSNLDVLQALTVSQESNRAFDKLYYTLRLDLLKLDIASATLPQEKE